MMSLMVCLSLNGTNMADIETQIPLTIVSENELTDQQRAAALRLLNTQPDADLLAQMLGLDSERKPS